MTSRPRNPIESFGPEVLAALIKGSKEVVKLDLPYRQAVRFQLRLNQLRHAMQHESHPLYSVAARVRISLVWGKRAGRDEIPELVSSKKVRRPEDPDAPTTLVLSPHDSEFLAALRAAGIEQHELPDDPLAAHTADDLLAQFRPKETS